MKEGCLFMDKDRNLKFTHFRKGKDGDAIITLAVKVGSLSDGDCKGIAHYLEHMLILSLANASQIAPRRFRIKGTTDFDKTLYEITCSDHAEDICQAVELLLEIYSGRLLKERDMEEAKRDINDEYERLNENNSNSLFNILMGCTELFDSKPLGTREGLNDITYEDIQAFHQRAYCNVPAHIIVVSRSGEECFLKDRETVRTIGHFQPLYDESQSPINRVLANKYVLRTAKATRCGLFVCEAPEGYEDRARRKVTKDTALVVLDYCLRKAFSTESIHIAKLRYNEFCTFLCVYLPQSDLIQCCSSPDQSSRYLYRETISVLVNNQLLPEIIKAYKSQISINELTPDLMMKELVSSALYHEPVYATEEYCSILDEVSSEEVIEQLSAWLNQGEEVAVVVEEAWLDEHFSTILGKP